MSIAMMGVPATETGAVGAPSSTPGHARRGRWRPPRWFASAPKLTTVPRLNQPSQAMVIGSYALSMISVLVLVAVMNLVIVSQLQHYTSQKALYDDFRLALAEGSVPVGQTTAEGAVVTPGTPVAMISVPAAGIVNEIVVEGTTSTQTMAGPGHRRDTPLPGQPGTSVIFGRAAGYGGIFHALATLRAGDQITVITGQGPATYRVDGVRAPNVAPSALTGTQGRLTLVTATGSPFQPSGLLRVDATLVSQPFERPALAFTSASMDAAEGAMAADPSHLYLLPWLMQLAALAAAAAVWSWRRWEHRASWLVFTPVAIFLGLAIGQQIGYLLPNLM